MEVLEKCFCDSFFDAKIRERFWYDELKALLNTCRLRASREETNVLSVESSKVYNVEHKDELLKTTKSGIK
jgi:hypothetical protein